MYSRKHIGWLVILTLSAITLGITACGKSSRELIYRVTGTTTEAHVTYTDVEGNTQEETVTLPWETRLEISDDIKFKLSASNNHPGGKVVCEVWLDNSEVGDKDSSSFVVCSGSVLLKNGNSDSHTSSFVSYTGETLLGDVEKLMNKGELDQALVKAEEIIELAPSYPLAYYYQGLVYTEVEKLDLALEAYCQAITLNPEFVDAYNKRGIIYANLGEYEQSIADFSTTIELAPDFAIPYYGRGVVYSLMGETELARADLLMVSDLSDDPDLKALAEQALAKLDSNN
jgi:hypothetical protein